MSYIQVQVFDSLADHDKMIKLSLNKTKWTGFLARTLVVFFLIFSQFHHWRGVRKLVGDFSEKRAPVRSPFCQITSPRSLGWPKRLLFD